MDVFRQLGDAVGDLYSTNYTNDHALNSPDLSVYAMSPTSIFMYEHDNEPIPLTKSSTDNMRGDSSNPLFDAPWSDEMTDLGCSIGDSFLSESSFCGSSLNDSDVKEAVWDFLGYDDVSSPLQHPDDDFLHSPTLAELNMEDTGTQNFDVYSGGAGQPPSAFSQQPVQAKTKPVLIKQNSQRHRQQDFTKKVHADGLSHDKYSSLFTLSKSHPIQSNQHKTTPMVPQSQSLHNQVKTEPLKFPSTNQSGDSITPSKNCLSFSNLFGQRTRTFASNQLHQAKDQSKVVVKTEAVAHDTQDDSSMDRKWEEIKDFIHQDTVRKMKQEEYDDFEDEAVSSPTKLTFKKHAHGYSVKSEKTEFQSSRKRTESASSGFESHDEGLGSEHEIEDCSDDDGILGQEEDVSDMSDVEDDTGLAASSSTGKYSRVKSRRSEYDDMTPNPRKLLHIGNELRKLNKIISDMAPVSELSGSARNRCRKEKNKLASRACRLKKKAQHEANKIKLSGLDNEHTRLLLVLTSIKKDMVKRVQNREGKHNASLNHRLDNLIKSNLGQMVAGHTNEYVNMVMERTAREKSNATKEK